RRQDSETQQHAEGVAVLADVNEHIEGKGGKHPERDERGSHAITELDAARFRRDDGHSNERDEEVKPAPEEAPELVQIAIDRDRPIPEHAVAIVDEFALDLDRFEEACEAAVRIGAREDPDADERSEERRVGKEWRPWWTPDD